MSEILSEFVIEPTQAVFTVEATNITVNPDAIQLNIYTGSAPIAGGSNTNVQFNEDGVLQGSNAFTFNNVTEAVTIDDLIIGNVANMGGTSNVKISGGTNGYVLQTDGTGNLSWTAQAGNVTGNGTPGGSNTQIQYNNAGNFGGSAGFTFNSASNVVNVPGNLIAAGEVTASYFNGNIDNANLANYAGYVVNSNQSNITAVGALVNLSVLGTISGNVISTTGDITSNTNITANGHFVGNLWGQANTAATVTTNAQPNITSVGTLTGLSTSGDINASGNTVYANVVQANLLIGNIGGNITANVSNANYASYAANIINSSQPNITSLGNLVDLRISNNSIHLGNSAGSNTQGNLGAVAIGVSAGRNNQSNTTIAIGQGAGQENQQTGAIAIGPFAGACNQSGTSIALGYGAGEYTQGNITIAIGYQAGANAQNTSAIAIGQSAGYLQQNTYAIAIGYQAGYEQQKANAISIGANAGGYLQATQSIAIGKYAGDQIQKANAIAIGSYAGTNAQGISSIAIGANAGYPNAQANNSIVLNATGANLNGPTANALFIKPIRDVTSEAGFTVALYYNPTTGEIGYK